MAELKFYVDRAGALGKLERTPQGGYRAPANIARVGILEYSASEMRRQGVDVPASFKDNDIVKVFNPAEVLQAAADSLRDAPVTNEHPARMVTPELFKDAACGHVSNVEFDGEYLKGKLVIQDAKLLADIEIGRRREVSAGYGAVTVFRPGECAEGAYDAIRDVIEYNHAAVVARGRAGSKVCIALDSMDIPTEEVPVAFKINGVEHAADQAQAAFDSFAGEMDAQLKLAKDEAEALKARVAELEAKVVEATSDAAIDAAVQARLDAKRKEEEKQARLKVVTDAFPDLDLSNAAEAYVDGLYLGAQKVLEARASDPNLALRGDPTAPVADHAPEPKPKMTAREKMLARARGEQVD